MKKGFRSALLLFSLLFLVSCGDGHAAADGISATEPTEQTESTEQTEPTESDQPESDQIEPTTPTEQTEPTNPADQTEPTGPIGQVGQMNHEAVQDYSSAEALRRPEHAWIRDYCYMGQNVDPCWQWFEYESTLFIGDGYSMYVLDDGWVYQSDTMGGRHVDIWKSVRKETAEMRIVKVEGNDFLKAREWAREQYPFPEYELQSCPCGELDTYENGFYLDIGFHQLGDDWYVGITMCEEKDTETLGALMEEMQATIKPFFYFPTAGELGRPEHTQLPCHTDGEGQGSEASLYVGNSYSMYMPNEGWTPKTGIMESNTSGAWKSTLHEGVELRIVRMNHWTPEDYNRAEKLDSEYTLIGEGEHGEVLGKSANGWRMEVCFKPYKFSVSSYGTYAIYKVYPPADAEGSEGIKSLLDAMTNTFEPFENVVKYNLMHRGDEG